MKWTFVHSEFVESDKAVLPVDDLSIQRGYGVFDYLKVITNTPVFIDEHLNRFKSSAKIMRLTLPYSILHIKDLLSQLIDLNKMDTSGIRLTLTGGSATDGFSITEPKLIIEQSPLNFPDDAAFKKGVALATYPYSRALPQAKSINYLMAIWLQNWIKDQQADEVLYHTDGIISECPRANIFMITKDHRLVTPKQQILKGITRQKILGIASSLMPVEEREITIQELMQSREVFITSTSKLVIPIVKIDKKPIHKGLPGDKTKLLLRLLKELQTNVHK